MSEAETGLFWRISTDFRQAERSGDVAAIRESLDDLDLMRELTDDEALRRRCGEILSAQVTPGAARR